jgi:FO synthase
VKRAAPGIHVHAFTPLEVTHGAQTLGIPIRDFLSQLIDAGLNSLPGTAAEILDDDVRQIICPDKVNTQEWLDVMQTAHELGLRSTATIMFGHVEPPKYWARHLLRIRALQEKTGGFTEFIPLPFVHMGSPVYLKGQARKGPTSREAILMHAVARLMLHPVIQNIQVSWVKMGEAGAAACLAAGVNDAGGTLMNESISRAAGTQHGQEMEPARMETMILAAGRVPQQRTTLYGAVAEERHATAREAPPLAPLPTITFRPRVSA